jgi:hypothetical protein
LSPSSVLLERRDRVDRIVPEELEVAVAGAAAGAGEVGGGLPVPVPLPLARRLKRMSTIDVLEKEFDELTSTSTNTDTNSGMNSGGVPGPPRHQQHQQHADAGAELEFESDQGLSNDQALSCGDALSDVGRYFSFEQRVILVLV